MQIIVRANDGTTHIFENQTRDKMNEALRGASLGRGFMLEKGLTTVSFAPGTVERVAGTVPPVKSKDAL